MSGMFGSSKGSGASYAAAMQAPVAMPQLPGSSIPVGYNFGNPLAQGSQQAGYGLQAPSWAQGVWSMPWWGQAAPNVGQAILQQQQGPAYGQQPIQTQTAAPAQTGLTPEEIQAIMDQLRRQQEQLTQLDFASGQPGRMISQG